MSFTACNNHDEKKLQRQMEPLAEEYLANEKISGYDELTIECIDTLSDLSYATLSTELLKNMEAAYQMQLDQAYANNDEQAQYLQLYVNEINRTIEDFYDLIGNGDLQRDNILLYMVTGSYQTADKKKEEFMFLVNPDKKSLHTLDPFGDNLLYKDIEEE